MKTFKSNRKNTGAAGVASKACAWILSIMLVVTGIAPSFAANAKAGNGSATKTAKVEAKAKTPSKAEVATKDKTTSKVKAPNKPATSKKDVSSSSKKQKSPKDKDDKNGKKKKFKNKGNGYFDLNKKGDVYATFSDADQSLFINVNVSSDPDGETDTYIEREKWLDMASKLGANFNDGYTFWANSQVKSIKFYDNYDNNANLPSDSSYFFAHFKGEITGCQYLNVDGVTNMKGIFSNIRIANPDVSTWNPYNATNTESMFEGASRANPDISRWSLHNLKNAKNMFNASGAKRLDLSKWSFSSEFLSNEANSHAMLNGCSSLEYLKTPKGLKTSISGANSDFKIVKLKKGNAPVIENESQNLYSSYIINSSGDKENVYHIYRKDKYAHVIFDKNGGDKEGWINHEIVEKGKSINESGGSLPAKEPVRFGYKFNGWSKIKNATAPDFDADAQVNTYATVYAVYKEDESYSLNYSDNVMAKPNTRGDLIISAKDTSGNMNIDGHKWNSMRKALGGSEDSWENSRIKNIKFNTNGIYLLPKNSEYFFRYCEGEIEGCENLNTSNVINMRGMFSNTTLANPKVANWDVSKVTNMEAMFNETTSAKPDVSKWNTSKVTNMGYVFTYAKLANPNVSNWNTSSVKSMISMFADTTVANPDVSNWDTSNVSDMRFMFSGAILANPDVSNWDVSSVTEAYYMFGFSKSANPDVSKWNVSKMTNMDFMFKGSAVKNLNLSKWKLNQELVGNDKATLWMFRDCMNIESLRTPEGLKTDISGANNNFKIVKLKRGNSATIEKENQNLNEEYKINASGDKEATYHIYRKDNYVGVTFDKNGGDDEAWVNHEIVEKGKSVKESGGNLPWENPNLAGDEFLGWSTKRDVNTSMFDENTKVNEDTTVYALWKKKQKVNVTFDSNGGSGSMDIAHVDKGGNFVLPISSFIPPADQEFDKWSVTVGSAQPVDKKPGESIVASDNVLVKAVWKAKTVNINFNANSGTGDMAAVEVNKGANYRLPECTFTPPVDKVFDKWSVVIGSAQPVDKNPGDEIVASDNVTVTAKWKAKPIPKVNITFNGNSGTGSMDVVQVDKGSDYKLPACAFTAPDGKEFDKWSVIVGSEPAVDKKPGESITASDNVTVIAIWKNKPVPKVNITFNANGGSGSMDSVSIDKGSSYTLPVSKFTPPAGMEFDKWAVTVGSAQTVDKKPGESIVASDNVAVKAVWKVKEVPVIAKVTLHADGITGYPQVIEVKRGETLGDKLPAKIEKAGYDFLGYSKENNGDINFFSDTVVKEDMNVYAVYKSNAPVVKKVENIRLTAGSLRMQLGDLTDVLAIVAPADATDKRVKFTLDRADILKIVSADDSAARVEAIGEGTVKVKAEALDGSGVTGEITIEVVRKPAKKVQVKLNAEGVAGYPKTLETEEGTSLDANLPMDLKKDGYIFRGWSYEKNGEVNFTKHTQVSKNTEIHAIFKKDEVSALFIAEGAAGFPKAVMVERGKKIGDQLPAAPVRAGYEFEGWSTESSFGTVNLTKDTVIDKDTIVYAVFKKQGAIVKQVSSITLGVTKSNIKAGDEADIIASILPSDADDKRLSWESSAPDKLKIEQIGDNFIRIKAEEEGTYTITAKAKDGSNVEANIEIKVVSKISAPISNKVKVMISADGVADYPKLIEIDKNTTLHGKLPTNIEKPGYKFKGFTKTMGNAADFDDNEVIKEDIRLYAVFEQVTAPTKKVTGIELSKSKSKVAVGDTVDILPSITPEDADNKALDYTVDNKDKALIYKNPDGTLRLYAMLKGKVTVTAKATDGSNVTKSIEIEIVEADKEQVAVTLNAEGIGGYPKQLTVDKGEALGNALPNVLDKADYDFRGWSTTPNGIIDVNRLTPMTSSISIYAVFTKKQVNVRMLAEGVNGYPKNVSLDIHSTLRSELPVSLNKEGYTFKGWSKDSFTGAVNVTAATKIDESMTIYAVFERQKPVTQKVESIKIEDLSSESKVINKEFNLFANILPESADDKTLEWSASDPAVKIVQKQNNLISVTVSAAGNYSITAKAKDGSNVEDTFAFMVGVPAPDVRNVKLEAEGITGYPKTIKVNKGEALTGRLPMDLEKDGYTFLGWSKTQGAAEADFDASLPVTDDLTLYAVFKKNVTPPAPGKTRVTLDGNGGVLAGGAEANIDIESGDTIKAQLESAVANKMFTKPGYKLIGFSRSKFATAADYNLDNPIYSDITLYAVYEEAPAFTNVTIKYQIFDMDDVVIENVAEGKPIGSKLDGHVKQRDGYRFLGFAKTQDATKPDFFRKSIVTNGLVLYPVYKEIGTVDKVKVAFKLNDGTDASLQSKEVIRYESLGDKMPTKDSVPERDGYLFTGWAKSKAARYPDFFRGTTVKGDMTVYAVWKSLYDEKLGQAVLKVAAKAKGYELTIEPPKANLHTGFDIFRSEKKDFKPDKDNKIATVDRNTLKFLDDKADNAKAYYYAVRAIDEDGSYNGTKVTFIGKLSDKVLAAPLPKDKGVTATVAGKGAVSLAFNKTVAAAGYKVTVAAPYDKKFKTIERFVKADKLVAAGADKVKASVTGLPMGKFLAFKLEALEADNNKLVEYGNSFAFMMGAVEKLTAKVNKKSRVLNVKFKAMKGVNGYEAKIVIGGKVKTIKLKKGKKKLRGFIVGSIKLPKKKGNYTFTIRAFKKIGKLKYYGQTITKVFK